MSALSELLSRIKLAAGLGIQANGSRDLYDVFGWHKTPKYQDFIDKYRRQDIAVRVINAPVNGLWSDPPKITGDDTFNAAWNDLLARIPVFFNVQRLDKLAGLGRFAILVIGFDDRGKLEEQIVRKKDTKVLYMQPYGEGSVTIDSYDENPKSSRFGLPLIYEVDPGTFDSNSGIRKVTKAQHKFKIHWSRVLHVAENILESPVFGSSRLEAVYNVLDDILKVTGGSAETYWLNANRGLHVNVDKDLDLDPEDAENLSEEMEEYQHNLRRIIRTRGVEVSPLGSDVADPTGTFDVQLSLLASCTGIPKRVLAGSEAGQLASQQDRANWSQRIEERITEYGQPIILIPLLRLLIDSGVLPSPLSLVIEWPDAFKMNPLERAQTSAQMARSAANLAKTLATIQQINHNNAVDSQETIISNPVPFGGDGTSTTETLPALLDSKPPKLELLTEDECRRIIGFGKHQPVFDSKSDTSTAILNPGG